MARSTRLTELATVWIAKSRISPKLRKTPKKRHKKDRRIQASEFTFNMISMVVKKNNVSMWL